MFSLSGLLLPLSGRELVLELCKSDISTQGVFLGFLHGQAVALQSCECDLVFFPLSVAVKLAWSGLDSGRQLFRSVPVIECL